MTTTVKLMKSAIPAAVFAFGVASASAGQAATYVLQNGAMDHGRTMTIAGIGSAKAAPIQFDGYIDDVVDKPFTNLVAFCVDVDHRISLGDYNPDLTYTDTIDLTTDSNFVGANILLKTEILQIGPLLARRPNQLAQTRHQIWRGPRARSDEEGEAERSSRSSLPVSTGLAHPEARRRCPREDPGSREEGP